MNIDFINTTALLKLSEKEFYSAQSYFRKNVRLNPGHESFNNLGVFYINEGMELSNGNVHRAEKLGFKYLKKAEACGVNSYQNLMALGNANFNLADYNAAYKYVKQACTISTNYIAFYDLGIVLYVLNKFEDAVSALKKSLELCDSSDYRDILITYGFSVLLVDKSECINILHELLKFADPQLILDQFILAYFCNQLQLAASFCREMFDSWALDVPVLAMMFECLFKLERGDEAKQYFGSQLQRLDEFDYNTISEKEQIKKIFFQQEYREKTISNYHYIPPFKPDCYYIGCEMHKHHF